jgi:membrane-associated phospholipid phosphatase
MTSGAQFRSAPPPAFGSAAFNADLAEVVTVAQNRTPQQLEIAKYWDSPLGTPTPIGVWNILAADYVKAGYLDERDATKVFALLQATMFDALIGCWEAKYHYWTLRPSQADGAVSLAFPNPNFPSYPSGHSCVSAAAGRVLTGFFPERTAELAAKVNEAGLSRVHAGIHYRFDVTAGQQLGRNVADWAVARMP